VLKAGRSAAKRYSLKPPNVSGNYKMPIINILLGILKSYSQLTFALEKKDFLVVHSKTTDKKISISFWEREHILLFDEWHWHFENNDLGNEELVKTVIDIISNQAKIKTTTQKGKVVRQDLELPNDLAHIKTLSTSKLAVKIWRKSEIEYNVITFI
jgi:hypothetical protein